MIHFLTAVTVGPDPAIVHEGGMQSFTCSASLATDFQWIIDGSPFDGSNPANVQVLANGVVLMWQNIPLEANGTTLQCSAVVDNLGTTLSDPVTLLVLGKIILF